MNEQFRRDADRLLSGLTWERGDAQRVLTAVKGNRNPMQRKFRVSFVLILCLLVTSAVALAIGFTRSRQYADMVKAREALMSRYGFTQDMISLFDAATAETDGTTTILFTASSSAFVDSQAVGQYTVTIDPAGVASASWSHDDADPAAWENADLTSPVWGAPQLAQMLSRYALYTQWWQEHPDVYTLPLEEQTRLLDGLRAAVAPLALAEAPLNPQAVIPAETPAANIADKAAAQIAAQALYERFGLTPDMLALFTQVQTLDLADGAQVRTIAYLPVSAETADGVEHADWRWVDVLQEKLGTYTVTLNAQDGAVRTAEWSLSGIADAGPYAENNWAQAQAYSADVLPYVLQLLRHNEPIIAKYPEDQREWFSLEDASAYDQAFRDAGFDPAKYNHALPKTTDITARQAVELAREAMTDGYALTLEQLDAFTLTVEYVADNGGTWWIGFYGSSGMGAVQLDAATGEIQMVTLMSGAASNG